jgi:hypothetical protein
MFFQGSNCVIYTRGHKEAHELWPMGMATAARRARLIGVLLSASRTNPKPLSPSFSTAPPATACIRDGDLLSRRLLRIRPPHGGGAAAAVERWSQERGHVSLPELRHAIGQLRRARRYKHALEVSSCSTILGAPASGFSVGSN